MFVSRQKLHVCMVTAALALAGCREQSSDSLPPSNLKSDEVVLLFPTYGRFDPDSGAWQCEIQGKVFEPEESSSKRAILIAALRSALEVEIAAGERDFLEERVRPFAVDNERGKSVTVAVADERFVAGTSSANGHFGTAVRLDLESSDGDPRESQVLDVEVVLREGDTRRFEGRLHLIPPQGVSVISDIDDTIKVSNVTDKSELLQSTFLREFEAVEGMPTLYTELSKSDVVFHYVSGSPWQLYQPLERFFSGVGYPMGTYHLKHFRLKDSSVFDLLASQQETKLAAIEPLLRAFPDRKFIMVGDTGEQDPEIYGQIARKHPEQIIGVFLRNVTDATRQDVRFAEAFRDTPDDLWFLFDSVSQISDEMVSRAGRKATARNPVP